MRTYKEKNNFKDIIKNNLKKKPNYSLSKCKNKNKNLKKISKVKNLHQDSIQKYTPRTLSEWWRKDYKKK